jgi:hypothetical protein
MPDGSYAFHLVQQYNSDLAARDPDRAAQIEWYVDHHGNIRLRDRTQWSARHRERVQRQDERRREQWKRRRDEGGFSAPVPVNETMDF